MEKFFSTFFVLMAIYLSASAALCVYAWTKSPTTFTTVSTAAPIAATVVMVLSIGGALLVVYQASRR